MFKFVRVYNNENAKQAVIAIGQELIRRADDICSDLDRVNSIDIASKITADEEVSLSVTKNYTAMFEKGKK
ncbi:MAG: hypothetical protein IKM97_04920 [Clostridia bacterium]|nr:hypothetical protein [Clostridia bacterium]